MATQAICVRHTAAPLPFLFSWGIAHVASVGRPENDLAQLVDKINGRYVQEKTRPLREREEKVKALRRDQQERALAKAKAERQKAEAATLLREKKAEKATLRREKKVRTMRAKQQQRALSRAMAERNIEVERKPVSTETPSSQEATGGGASASDVTSTSDQAVQSTALGLIATPTPARTPAKLPETNRFTPSEVDKIIARSMRMTILPALNLTGIRACINTGVENTFKYTSITAFSSTGLARNTKAPPSLMTLLALHAVAQSYTENTTTTSTICDLNFNIKFTVLAPLSTAPRPPFADDFAALPARAHPLPLTHIDQISQAAAGPAPLAIGTENIGTEDIHVSTDDVSTEEDLAIVHHSAHVRQADTPAAQEPPSEPPLPHALLGPYATASLVTLIQGRENIRKLYTMGPAGALCKLLFTQNKADRVATEEAFQRHKKPRLGYRLLDTLGHMMCLQEGAHVSWAMAERQRRDIVIGLRYEDQELDYVDHEHPGLRWGLRDVGGELRKVKAYRAQADEVVNRGMDVLCALVSASRYSQANYHYKLKAASTATGYTASLLEESAGQTIMKFRDDPYTHYHVSLTDGPWIVARAYERKVLSTNEAASRGPYARSLSTPSRRVTDALNRLISLRPIATWCKEELSLIQAVLRLLDVPHPDLHPYGGPAHWLKREKPVLSGPDRWVDLAAAEGVALSNERRLSLWGEEEGRLDTAREARASTRYQPPHLQRDLQSSADQRDIRRSTLLDHLREWGELLDEVVSRELLQCELRTRLCWALCTYVHHEMRLGGLNAYSARQRWSPVELDLPFAYQLLGVPSACAMSEGFKVSHRVLISTHPDKNKKGSNKGSSKGPIIGPTGAQQSEQLTLTRHLIGCKEAMQSPHLRVAIEEKVYETLGLGLLRPCSERQ